MARRKVKNGQKSPWGQWALSNQQKFWFEISEILRVQWNGLFRLYRPDPSHRALGYCSCRQDTKEWYWGQQFCQMERLDRSKRTTFKAGPEYSSRTKPKWSVPFDVATEITGILG